MTAFRTQIAVWWQQFTCRLQHARRTRQTLRELSQLSAQELRDIGISHAALAEMASPRDTCCN